MATLVIPCRINVANGMSVHRHFGMRYLSSYRRDVS